MRHLRNISKLGRNCGHRKALLVNLACSLIEHGQIKTTVNRAKEARKLVDKLITYAKKGGDHNRRLAAQRLKINTPAEKLQGKKLVLDKLFGQLAEAYAARPGGYTRIIHLGHRIGDGSEFVMIQLVEAGDAAKKETQPAAGDAVVEAEAKAE